MSLLLFLIFLGYLLVFLLLMNWNVYVGIGFILITSTLIKMYLPNIKGYIGEKRIHKMLQKLGEDYKVFHDIYVKKHDGNTTQIDHVVLSKFGVFVIETKNYQHKSTEPHQWSFFSLFIDKDDVNKGDR